MNPAMLEIIPDLILLVNKSSFDFSAYLRRFIQMFSRIQSLN